MNKRTVIGLLVLIGLVVLVYPSTSSSHFDANDWDHNQAHFDTPIADSEQVAPTTQVTIVTQPTPTVAPTVAPTQVVVGDPNQVVTGSQNQQMVITEDGRIVTVDGSTKVVQLRRSIWDSNFWNIMTVNNGYYGGYANGGCGYNYCGSYRSSHYYKSYRTHRPYRRGYSGHRNNGGHNGGNNGGNNGGHKSSGRTFNRDRRN